MLLEDNGLPMLGAQIFIEPGQTHEITESWFKTLAEHGMTVCRIRMFEAYMHQPDGSWDFSLFDRAFRLAEKYGIKVIGTFFPSTEKTDIGGWKFPKDTAQLNRFAEYIKKASLHFKQYACLQAWVLINEPGGGFSDSPFFREMREKWETENPQIEYHETGYPVLVDLQNGRFKQYLTSWMLNWIANEVRKYDKDIHLHVNNHALFANLLEYDFKTWSKFLNSLGGSAHPGYHFVDFNREQYALAMSANSEILLSGAGKNPWFMTEVQGGNNTYSSEIPLCPTAEEITQWLWTIIGTEGKAGLFWTFNPRSSGKEAGEWALLDFNHQPTERVESVKNVAHCLQNNEQVFSKIRKYESGINLLYNQESFWTEEAITKGEPAGEDGRKTGLKSLFGYFKALSETGVNANIKAFDEFNFEKDDFKGVSIILANQITLPVSYVSKLEHFVEKGGKLLVDGLTGYYNEQVINQFLTGFPFKKLFGGSISEFRHQSALSYLELKNVDFKIPCNGWIGTISHTDNTEVEVLSEKYNKSIAIRTKYGKGEVVWIPSTLGLGAWEGDANPLAAYLKSELALEKQPLLFTQYQHGVLMKTLLSGKNYLTIVVNKSGEQQNIKLASTQNFKPNVLFADKGGSVSNASFTMASEETMVIEWS